MSPFDRVMDSSRLPYDRRMLNQPVDPTGTNSICSRCGAPAVEDRWPVDVRAMANPPTRAERHQVHYRVQCYRFSHHRYSGALHATDDPLDLRLRILT